MTDQKLPPRLSNGERHRRTLQALTNAIRCLKAAVKEQDGLEWAGVLEGHVAELELVAQKLPKYVADYEAGVR